MSEMVPEGWKYQRLGMCSQILDSKRIPLNAQERAKRKGVYPYYGANGIQDYIDDFIFDGEYILLAEDGGYFSEYASRPIAQYVKDRFWVNNHAHILKSTAGNSNKWIYYSLVHKNILKYINGGTRSKLNQSDLRDIGILLPPLPEQEKIATILTSVDEVIEKTESQISKLQDLKKGMMQELLTQGIGHTEFKDSPVGRIPVGWEIKKLHELCCAESTITYGVLKPGKYIEGGVPLLQVKDLKNGKIDTSEIHRISISLDEEYARSRVQCRDVLISLIGTVGRVSLMPETAEVFNIHRNIGRIRVNNPEWVFLYLQSQAGVQQIQLASSGSSQSALNLSELKEFMVPISPLDEQKKITDILTSIDDSIQQKQKKLAQTKNLKKSLMQDLLTGKVRVSVN